MPTTTKTAHRTFHASVNLPEDKRQALIELLNQRLADTFDLYSQIKQAHWNVKGLNFFQLHELFDTLAGEVFPYVDEIAERVTALGGTALGTSRQAAANSSLPEYPADAVDGVAHLKALIERYAKYSTAVREAIDESDDLGDKDTADLFTAVSRTADKNLWFLEAHLQSSKA